MWQPASAWHLQRKTLGIEATLSVCNEDGPQKVQNLNFPNHTQRLWYANAVTGMTEWSQCCDSLCHLHQSDCRSDAICEIDKMGEERQQRVCRHSPELMSNTLAVPSRLAIVMETLSKENIATVNPWSWHENVRMHSADRACHNLAVVSCDAVKM